MFSRNKSNSNPPKPPTKAEILDDLETFQMDHILNKSHSGTGDEITFGAHSTSDTSLNAMDSSKINKRERKESEADGQLDEWWTSFEKFLSDIDKLEIYQKQFDVKKANLAKLDESIGLMADDIQTRINDSLQKAMNEMPEMDPDLK